MSAPHEPHTDDEPKSVKTILVVEDDADVGEFFVAALKEETPHQAILATDGFQALKMVRSIKPDLFVLDYFLPGMDGIELYNQLHTTEGLEDVPVLFISANMSSRVLAKQDIHYIKKPFELDELLQAIENLLAG